MAMRLECGGAPWGLAVLVVSLCASVGCAPDADGSAVRLGSRGQAIAGGYDDPDDTAVVGILYIAGSDGASCSGTLIAPNVVLTARHCVSATLDTAGGGVVCGTTRFDEIRDPANFFVTTNMQLTMGTAGEYLVEQVVGLPVEHDDFCGHDMAILILNDNVPASKATPFEPEVDGQLEAGAEYSAIGYGAVDGVGSDAGTRRRRDGLHVDCVAERCSSEYVDDREWAGETGVCQGDSGGPALVADGKVVGVTSRGGTDCADPIYGYVYAWRQWLKDTVVVASGMGEYLPPDWTAGATTSPEYSMPVGKPCQRDDDCFSQRCLHDGTGAYCTRPCTQQAPCPEDYTCDTSGQVCRKVGPSAQPVFNRADKGSCAARPVGPSGSASGATGWLGAAIILCAMGRRRERSRTRR